jgi:hypothetical protein
MRWLAATTYWKPTWTTAHPTTGDVLVVFLVNSLLSSLYTYPIGAEVIDSSCERNGGS